MQTILGSGGAIGIELAKALSDYEDKIRLVSRNPKQVNGNDELISADLLIKEEMEYAVKGSAVVYLTIGLPYSTKVWRANWPIIIENVISSCKKHNSKLVFYDNVYMYDPDHLGGMTENTPSNPCSEKGKVRETISKQITSEFNRGDLRALIARSADYYGPSIKNTSVLTETVFNNFIKGKKANWFCSLDHKHSFTYTPDAGRATALLGNTDSAYDQIWHLPTASNPLTGREWIDKIAEGMGVKPKTQVVSKLTAKALGIFIPVMRELSEMTYQYDRDYIFDSSKFEEVFKVSPTPYDRGIKEILEKDYR